MKCCAIVTFIFLILNCSDEAVAVQGTVTAGSLLRDLDRVESIREIKDVQRNFGQLSQYGRWSDMAALFAEDGILRWGSGNRSILEASDAVSAVGPNKIEEWLRTDAGNMDGIRPGSLHVLINEMPLVTLSIDGQSAKGRWHALRLLGDGSGKTRIQGGIFENDYVLILDKEGKQHWRIALLRYYPMFSGDYKNGWKNAGGNNLPIVPYHFTPDQAGIPVLLPDDGNTTTQDLEPNIDELEYRISQLNEEDEVRNLQHSYGYYVDRRMWTDVISLFTSSGSVEVDGTVYTGSEEIHKWLEKMGPEGLERGHLNEHLIFETIVSVSPHGRNAVTRGLEMGMIGDTTARTASWEFSVFRNSFLKDEDTGIWKIQNLNITHLITANYSDGWGDGGLLPQGKDATRVRLPFSDPARKANTQMPKDWLSFWPTTTNTTTSRLADLQRRLARSAAFDETENVSAAYGYYADDIRCDKFAALHASNGFKESPGTGWYRTPDRIERACTSRYGAGTDNPQRPNVPFHWRPQPVILVSEDGRSTSLRARIMQIGTSRSSSGGFTGVYGFNGGMYHDQFVLENISNGTSRRKLWCLTIDEFYWQSASWAGGWAGVDSTHKVRAIQYLHDISSSEIRRQSSDFPPDVSLKDPKMAEREAGFNGGPTDAVRWPEIQRMWWSYRNPVSGQVPDASNGSSYWGPGCVPCRTARPDWALIENGYQEPPTGPTLLTATLEESPSLEAINVTITVTGGPEEPAQGDVELRVGDRSSNLLGWETLDSNGSAVITVKPENLPTGTRQLAAYYLGSSRLMRGRATIILLDSNATQSN